jgi:hypothetical protein
MMAVPADILTTTNPAPTRCAFHHGPADRCPPVDPELGDLIPELHTRGISMILVSTGLYPERCEDCLHTDGPVLDAIAIVCHKAPSEPLPDGYTYRAHVCAVHLRSNVTWEVRRGCHTWVEIPTELGGTA